MSSDELMSDSDILIAEFLSEVYDWVVEMYEKWGEDSPLDITLTASGVQIHLNLPPKG